MMKIKRVVPTSIILVLGICILCIGVLFLVLRLGTYTPFVNPVPSFDQHELYGIWEASYCDGCKDRLSIYGDGLFEQEYQQPNNQFNSGKSTWRLERLIDGRMQLHLKTARYYRLGASFFEQYGYTSPLYDPFSKNSIIMDNVLILEVVYKHSRQLVLHHMLLGPDEGFPIFDTGSNYFQKTK